MSFLWEAFVLPINRENKIFVENPYIPFPTLTYPIAPNEIGLVSVSPQMMTVARSFDIKYGSKNYFAPSYYTPQVINHGSKSGFESQKLPDRSGPIQGLQGCRAKTIRSQ